MNPSARIASSIELLTKIESAPIPIDNMIRDYMAARRYIGSKDRTAIVERIYRMTRAHARLGWWLSRQGSPDTPRLRVIADLALNERMPLVFIQDLFIEGKYGTGVLNNIEKDLVTALSEQSLDHPEMPEGVSCECPAWAIDMLRIRFGDDFARQMAAMTESAPLDLRVNTLKGTVEEAIESLKNDGVETAKTPYSPVGLRAVGKPHMSETKAFKNGLVEIQDEGSQLIGLVSGAAPGMRVLDFCAGGGGKTLALAAMMNNKGNIVATDNDPRRLEKGKPRFRKAGVHNVELRSLDDEKNRKWLRRQKETMDVVLVDAPCSSSGTWRRNPDLRWRQYGPTLAEILVMQRDILDRVADKVKPGGRLVYATCSLFTEENEAQVEAFFARHPGYAILPLNEVWPGAAAPPCEGPYLRLSPADHATDGFFTAVLQRKVPV